MSKQEHDSMGYYDTLRYHNPTSLPFNLQYEVLHSMCKLAEGSCFDFSRTYFPEAAYMRNIKMPEQIELYLWLYHFQEQWVPESALAHWEGQVELDEIMSRLVQLRHAFVHRKDMIFEMIVYIAQDELMFFKKLKDHARAEKMKAYLKVLTGITTWIDDEINIKIKKAEEDISKNRENNKKCHDKIHDLVRGKRQYSLEEYGRKYRLLDETLKDLETRRKQLREYTRAQP